MFYKLKKMNIVFVTCYLALITNGKMLVEVEERDLQENDSLHNRIKRQAVTGLTSGEQTEAVDVHNYFRAKEGASNMVYMKFNQYLADMAQEWADSCIFDHGQPERNVSTMPYNPVGQNLLITSASALNMTWAIEQWYNEKQFYTFSTRACQSGQLCGHYTQVVWYRSLEIGCGVLKCANVTELYNSNVYHNMINLVCNYGPSGNLKGADPYVKGTPCTKCESGDMSCYQTLCKPDCVGNGCSCNAECNNCANVSASCTCECANGWRGRDCSERCEDTDPRCGKDWQAYLCTDPTYGKTLHHFCPSFCGVCTGAGPNDPVCPSSSYNPTTATTVVSQNSLPQTNANTQSYGSQVTVTTNNINQHQTNTNNIVTTSSQQTRVYTNIEHITENPNTDQQNNVNNNGNHVTTTITQNTQKQNNANTNKGNEVTTAITQNTQQQINVNSQVTTPLTNQNNQETNTRKNQVTTDGAGPNEPPCTTTVSPTTTTNQHNQQPTNVNDNNNGNQVTTGHLTEATTPKRSNVTNEIDKNNSHRAITDIHFLLCGFIFCLFAK